MSSDLIILVVALTLCTAVVILGLRRNLSETTRSGLPRFGGDPERATATLGLYEGEERRRRPLSPRQRRWMIWAYLLMSLTFAAFAVLSAHGRLFNALLAATFALNAAVFWLKRSPFPGAWIEPRLDGWGGKVKEQIPQIFDAYVRIFHPASGEKGNPVSWGEVASALGSIAHREMQWHAIVGSYDSSNFQGSRWSGENPSISELDEEPLAALCAILERHTSRRERCYFGISTIHGGVEEEFPGEPLFRLPHRDFAILGGSLSAIDQIGVSRTSSNTISFSAVLSAEDGPPPDPDPSWGMWRMAPNLIWPEDRAWFVASEYDFDSTLVGGSRELIDAILDSPDLEAWEVDPEVSLQDDADKVNPVPDPPPASRR